VAESSCLFIEKACLMISIYTYIGMRNSTPFFAAFERERRKRCCFFREIRCNVEGDNRTIGRVTGATNGYDYVFVARWGIIIVAVHANRECNPVG